MRGSHPVPASPRVLTASDLIGRAPGRHAGPPVATLPWALWLATATWAVLMLRQWPCLVNPGDQYKALCYTDITALWYARELAGGTPYLDTNLEYPVLTGGWIHVISLLTRALGRPDPEVAFFGLNAVGLFACFLGLVVVHRRLAPDWTTLWLAASPLVVANGLVNWDLLPVLLTSAALLAWRAERPGVAGALLGLGAAAKLYPLLLLVPLAALCLRDGRLDRFTRAVASGTLAWAVANVPVYLASPAGWWHFWTFNADRGADLGSLWFVLADLGVTVPRLSLVTLVLMAAGAAGVVALLLLAPRTPTLAQGALLVVLVFCLVNKVYSPQYALWVLPLALLAHPVRRDLGVLVVGELVYWLVVWPYLGGALFAGDGHAPLYAAAVLVRVGVHVWLAGRVVARILTQETP